MKVAQLCLTICSFMDCSLPSSSVHGILQARLLEWVATPFSRVCSWCRYQTQVSCIVGRFFTIWATKEAQSHCLSIHSTIMSWVYNTPCAKYYPRLWEHKGSWCGHCPHHSKAYKQVISNLKWSNTLLLGLVGRNAGKREKKP